MGSPNTDWHSIVSIIQRGISNIQIKCAAGNSDVIEHKKVLKQSRKLCELEHNYALIYT